MSTPVTGLLSTVMEALEAHDTRYQRVGDESVAFRIRDTNVTHDFFISADDETGLVTLYAPFGPHVPDARRVAAAEAIARINSRLATGHFELDFDDGELRFRSAIDVEGGLLSTLMVDNLVRSALWACEQYCAPLMSIAFGDAEPAVAVAAVG